MGAQRMICSACGYDAAGLPLAGGQANCPECGRTGPPIPQPIEWGAPWWVVVAIVVAAATNLVAMLGGLVLFAASLMADGGTDALTTALLAGYSLISALTLVAMMLAACPRVLVPRLFLTVIHALLIATALVHGMRWLAGLAPGMPLSLMAVMIGQSIASLIALNANRLGRRVDAPHSAGPI